MMPGMDGYEVCRHLKKDEVTQNIAVLMLTAKGGVEEKVDHVYEFAGKVKDRLKGFDSGAMEFLTKPVKAKDLLQRVKAVLWASGFPV
jgi:putative two-component system response regulator